jgi:transposase
MIKRYTTKEVAKKIGVGHQTLLRWLYAKRIAEPERLRLGGATLRLWTEDDIRRARQYKTEGAASRRSRKMGSRKKKRDRSHAELTRLGAGKPLNQKTLRIAPAHIP